LDPRIVALEFTALVIRGHRARRQAIIASLLALFGLAAVVVRAFLYPPAISDLGAAIVAALAVCTVSGFAIATAIRAQRQLRDIRVRADRLALLLERADGEGKTE
jgi:hypothetical protein